MKRFRFSLRLLIVLVSALALFLGYSQYRRKQILKVCEELKTDGYSFAVPDQFVDKVWQRKPTIGTVYKAGEDEYLRPLMAKRTRHGIFTRHDLVVRGDDVQKLKKLGMVRHAE